MLSKTEIRSRLEAARDELAEAEAALAAICAEENTAIGSAATHSAWRSEQANATAEIDRLRKVLGVLESEAKERSRVELEVDLRRRHAQQLVTNAELARRIHRVVAEANKSLLPLAHDMALAAREDREINAALLDDLEPIVSADFLARSKPALARTDIGRERILLWVKTGTDFVIGNQDEVKHGGNGRGLYKSGMSTFHVEQRVFEKVSYHPEEPAPSIQPLLTMRLPCADEPGFAFDGSNFPERAALAVLDRAAQGPRDRPIEIELVPIPSEANVTVGAA